MSDVAPTVAPVAQTVTEGTAVPTPAPTVTEAAVAPPRNAREMLERVSQRARGQDVAPSPVTTAPAAEQPRGPDGKFLPKAGDEPAAQVPAPASEGVAAPNATAAEAVAERVRFALPEGHPLRDRGLTELPFDFPKEHEEIVRNLVNEPVRKQQIAQAHEVAREATRRAIEAQAEAEFWRENAGAFLTPEFYAKFADIKQTYGDADAEKFKRATLMEAQDKLSERRAEVGREMAVREITNTAQKFRGLAIQDAQQQFPGWDQAGIDQAMQAYGAWLHATGTTSPKAEDWYRIARPVYESSPAGQQRRAYEAQRIATEAGQKAQQEAADRERQALESAAQSRSRNPLQGVPNVQTGLTVPGGGGGPRTAKEFLAQTAAKARGY